MAASNKVPDNLNYLSNISFRLSIEDTPHLTWFCQSVTVPGVSVNTVDVVTPFVNIPYAGGSVSFEELSVTFMVDEHLKNWIEIYDRVIALGLAEGHEKYRLLKSSSDLTPRGGTVSTIVLTVLTSGMNPQIEFHFNEAFPISISSLEFNSSSTDVEYFTATAGFRYTNYEIKNLLNN
jgi:hypothetical protein